MRGRYVITEGIYRYTSYLLNPALGDAVIDERLALLDRLDRKQGRLEVWMWFTWCAVIGFSIATFFAWDGHPAGSAFTALVILVAGTLTVVRGATRHRALTTRVAWAKDGDAVAIDFLGSFKRSGTTEADIWRAANLYLRAHNTASRAAWGQRARQTGRLAPGAEGALDDARESASAMYREVASILDPGGTFTSEWLLERVAP